MIAKRLKTLTLLSLPLLLAGGGAVAAKPLANLEAEWGDGLFTGDKWIELVYPGVY